MPFHTFPPSQLAAVDPDQYGIAMCSIDGQRYGRGDTKTEFCVQSCSKPITYCIALEENGIDKVHQHVSREPSGRSFNEIVLDTRREPNVPHNPLINAGAIMSCALVQPTRTVQERLAHCLNYWGRLGGGATPRMDEDTYKSESATAWRNRCLTYVWNNAEWCGVVRCAWGVDRGLKYLQCAPLKHCISPNCRTNPLSYYLLLSSPLLSLSISQDT